MPGDKKKTLGMLLSTGPENYNWRIVLRIAESALKQGINVKIFLMDDGIYNLKNERFKNLFKCGVEFSLCGQNARERNIEKIDDIPFGSQFDHSEIVKNCDRYLGFFR